MPELAAFYVVGFVVSLGLTCVFVFLWSRFRAREELRTLNTNLQKAGLYWSESQDRLVKWNEAEAISETQRARRQLWMTGAALSFLSWAGLLFIFILMLSYRFLARSRFERRLLTSDLARNTDLTPDQISERLEEVRREFQSQFTSS